MIRILIGIIVLFYTIRVVSYGIYTFKDKNIAGGISVMVLSLMTFSVFIATIIDILK
jgi:hypothetical protein